MVLRGLLGEVEADVRQDLDRGVEQHRAHEQLRPCAPRAPAPAGRRSCGRPTSPALRPRRSRADRRGASRGSTAAPSSDEPWPTQVGREHVEVRRQALLRQLAIAPAVRRDAVHAHDRGSVRVAPLVDVESHPGQTNERCSACSTTSTATSPRSSGCSQQADDGGIDRWLLGGDYGTPSPWPLETLDRLQAAPERDLDPRQRRALAARAAARPAGGDGVVRDLRAASLSDEVVELALRPAAASRARRRALRARLAALGRRELRAAA